jgi:rhamnose transport system substrate-binding protein
MVVFVPKLVGIPFFNAARDGAEAAAARLHLQLLYTGPTAADAGLQVEVLDAILARHPAVVAVSCDDPNAVVPVLRRARRYGSRVLTWDSDSQPAARDWFINQVDPERLGRHVTDVLAAEIGGRGKYAIITGALTAANLNEWMHWMRVQQEEKYPRMQLVGVVPGNDDQQQAYVQAQQLIQAHPDLRGIIGNSSAAPPAAARAVEQAGLAGKIAVVGLSTPNLMRHYIDDGTVKTITLWDPRQLGALTVEVANLVMHGGTPRDAMDFAGIGRVRVDPERRVIIMGPPVDFTRANIAQYHF